jgi:hypothetical protein
MKTPERYAELILNSTKAHLLVLIEEIQSEAYAEGYNSGVHDTVIACAENAKLKVERMNGKVHTEFKNYVKGDYITVDKESIMSVEQTLKNKLSKIV